MSRIGKQPVEVPAGVEVKIEGNLVTVKGPKGELKRDFHPKMKITQQDNQLLVEKPDESKESRSLHGLTRSLLSNMVEGVTKGFEKRLEIIGVGYKANPSGSKVTLNLGFSHPIEYKAPDSIKFEMDAEEKNTLVVSGIDKEIVGETAAKVRSFRSPEPYKGKGIRYKGEYVRRKAGKAAAGSK